MTIGMTIFYFSGLMLFCISQDLLSNIGILFHLLLLLKTICWWMSRSVNNGYTKPLSVWRFAGRGWFAWCKV